MLFQDYSNGGERMKDEAVRSAPCLLEEMTDAAEVGKGF